MTALASGVSAGMSDVDRKWFKKLFLEKHSAECRVRELILDEVDRLSPTFVYESSHMRSAIHAFEMFCQYLNERAGK